MMQHDMDGFRARCPSPDLCVWLGRAHGRAYTAGVVYPTGVPSGVGWEGGWGGGAHALQPQVHTHLPHIRHLMRDLASHAWSIIPSQALHQTRASPCSCCCCGVGANSAEFCMRPHMQQAQLCSQRTSPARHIWTRQPSVANSRASRPIHLAGQHPKLMSGG
jgi:hypothetical protein